MIVPHFIIGIQGACGTGHPEIKGGQNHVEIKDNEGFQGSRK